MFYKTNKKKSETYKYLMIKDDPDKNKVLRYCQRQYPYMGQFILHNSRCFRDPFVCFSNCSAKLRTAISLLVAFSEPCLQEKHFLSSCFFSSHTFSVLVCYVFYCLISAVKGSRE